MIRFVLALLFGCASWICLSPVPNSHRILRRRPQIPRLKNPWRVRTKEYHRELLVLLVAFRSAAMSGGSVLSASYECINDYGSGFLSHSYSALQTNADPIPALRADAQALGLKTLNELADILEITRITGASIQRPIDRLIKTVQRDLQHRRELNQELASVKATIVLLSFLPLFGPVLGYLLGINVTQWFVTSMWGILCLIIGFGFEALGWLWMRMLLRRVAVANG